MLTVLTIIVWCVLGFCLLWFVGIMIAGDSMFWSAPKVKRKAINEASAHSPAEPQQPGRR